MLFNCEIPFVDKVDCWQVWETRLYTEHTAIFYWIVWMISSGLILLRIKSGGEACWVGGSSIPTTSSGSLPSHLLPKYPLYLLHWWEKTRKSSPTAGLSCCPMPTSLSSKRAGQGSVLVLPFDLTRNTLCWQILTMIKSGQRVVMPVRWSFYLYNI